jgi:drug/metabolite transporter (DMT)-like permease
MLGLILALLSGISFAASTVFMRKGVYTSGESFSPLPITAFFGTLIFAIILLIAGDFRTLATISLKGFLSLAAAGIIHFVAGRILFYTSVRLIGANRASPIMICYILFAAVLGIILFEEPVTVTLILAALLIFGGIILVGMTGESGNTNTRIPRSIMMRGLFGAIGAAICWGITPILVKIGLEEGSSTMSGVFISYIASLILTAGLSAIPANFRKIRRLNRASITPILIGSGVVAGAQLLRYVALDYSPVSMVSPIVGSSTLFIFFFSFIINREIESFNPKIILGAVAAVIGIVLMFWAA